MPDLQTLLERAVDRDVPLDVTGDLRRGRRAVTRRRRTFVGGSAALLLGVGAGIAAYPRSQSHDRIAAPAVSQPADQLLHTEFFDVPPAPDGWHLVGANAYVVVYRQDGDTSAYLDRDFERAIVLYLGADRVHDGPPITYDGRTFYEWGDGGAGLESMAVEQSDGNTLRMQYPKSAGFASEDMMAFLDEVVPLAGAVATHG